MKSVDTAIIGRKTDDKVLSWGIPFPHAERKCYVLSRTKTGDAPRVTFFNGDITALIAAIRATDGLDNGTSLFTGARAAEKLKFIRSQTFPNSWCRDDMMRFEMKPPVKVFHKKGNSLLIPINITYF